MNDKCEQCGTPFAECGVRIHATYFTEGTYKPSGEGDLFGWWGRLDEQEMKEYNPPTVVCAKCGAGAPEAVYRSVFPPSE